MSFFIPIVTSVLPTGPTEVTVHICANNKFFVAKSNKFDYSDEKTCVFQIFFVILCAEIKSVCSRKTKYLKHRES